MNKELFMKIREEDKIEIVEKSIYLDELLDNEYIPDLSSKGNELYDYWYRSLFEINNDKNQKIEKSKLKDHENALKKRMEWSAWNLDDIKIKLRGGKLKNNNSFPKWSDNLNNILSAFKTKEDKVNEFMHYIGFDNLENYVPNVSIYRRFYSISLFMLEKLKLRIDYKSLISQEAIFDLQKAFIDSFGDSAVEVFRYKVFLLEKAMEFNASSFSDKKNSTEKEEFFEKACVNFFDDLNAESLKDLFLEFPVMARMMCEAIDRFLDAHGDMLSRYSKDLKLINNKLGSSKKTKIKNIKTSMSDSHRSGKTVMILTLDTNKKIVYKPRTLLLDKKLHSLFNLINSLSSTEIKAHVPKVISRKEYGWAEFIENIDCKSEEEAKHFFLKSGFNIALFHMLKATDLHFENIVAEGTNPIVVDYETIFQPDYILDDDTINDKDILFKVGERLNDSVIFTAYLPTVLNTRFGKVEIGALQPIPGQNNLPSLNGVLLNYKDYKLELLNGALMGFNLFKNNKKAITEQLKNFINEEVRIVIRNTNLYAEIIKATLKYQNLKSGLQRSVLLDSLLIRAFIKSKKKPMLFSIVMEELKSILRHDVPYFTHHLLSNKIDINKKEAVFKSNGLQATIDRINNLDDISIEDQLLIMSVKID